MAVAAADSQKGSLTACPCTHCLPFSPSDLGRRSWGLWDAGGPRHPCTVITHSATKHWEDLFWKRQHLAALSPYFLALQTACTVVCLHFVTLQGCIYSTTSIRPAHWLMVKLCKMINFYSIRLCKHINSQVFFKLWYFQIWYFQYLLPALGGCDVVKFKVYSWVPTTWGRILYFVENKTLFKKFGLFFFSSSLSLVLTTTTTPQESYCERER